MKASGPHLNRNFYLQDRPRAFFSDLPISLDSLGLDYICHYDDFLSFTDNEVYEDVSDASTTFALSADAAGGVMILTSQATTNDSGVLLQAVNTNFLCKAGQNLWFESRVSVADADDMDMFVGLADTAATNPEAVVAEGLARVGFELIDGSAVLQAVIDNDTAATKVSTGVSAADGTYMLLGFRVLNDQVLFYVNRTLVARQSIPSAIAAVTLGPSFFELSGSVSGTKSMNIDYVFVAQKR